VGDFQLIKKVCLTAVAGWECVRPNECQQIVKRKGGILLISQEGLRKTVVNLSQDSRCAGRGSNRLSAIQMSLKVRAEFFQ
jgi:hypothetical protein